MELLKQVPEAFAHDARRYVPRTNQGDVVSGLAWNNRTDYFLDTWEGFSQVLEDMSPKRLQVDTFLPQEESMYGVKGYVKRKFKEAARFEKISFPFDGTNRLTGIFQRYTLQETMKEKDRRNKGKSLISSVWLSYSQLVIFVVFFIFSFLFFLLFSVLSRCGI